MKQAKPSEQNNLHEEYMNKKQEIAWQILAKFKECGGNINDVQRAFYSGGKEASKKVYIDVIGEQAVQLINQFDNIIF